jgi:flagellar protein FliO/FliZ
MRLALTLFVLFLLPAAARAAGTEVIHPRSTAQSGAPADQQSARPSWPLATALGLCAAAGGLVWFRRRQPGAIASRAAKKLSIAESRPLGNRQHLVVADYAGRKFLLGVCPGRIDMLTALDEAETETES